MGREINCPASGECSRIPNRNLLILVTLCATCMLQFASEARAQCAARDVSHNKLLLASEAPKVPIRSAAEAAPWKRVELGTFKDSLALRNALDAAGCNIGGLASEILARPAFAVSSTRASVELVAISAVELGFTANTVTLGALYARARQLGFGFADAEVGPQLRLQYSDQPVGEFLVIGMEPMMTWSGEPAILTVANSGAGLALVGQDGRPDADVSAISRFVFVRSREAVPEDQSGKEVAFVPW